MDFKTANGFRVPATGRFETGAAVAVLHDAVKQAKHTHDTYQRCVALMEKYEQKAADADLAVMRAQVELRKALEAE